MEIWFKKTIANIAFYMMRILDGMMSLFRAFTGLDSVNVKTEQSSESVDILSVFLENPIITDAFWFIVIISVACLTFFTGIAIVKAMATHKKQQGKVFTQFLAAVAAFVIAQFVIFGGIAVSNEILSMVDGATNPDISLTLSQRIFDLAIEKYEDGNNGYRNGSTAKDFKSSMSASKVFGSYKESKITGMEKAPGTEQEFNEETGNWETIVDDGKLHNGDGIVDLYKTNLFILFATPLILIITIGIALLKLSRRIFDIIFLYLVMPFTISSIPLDEGSRFKLWRENIISKTLSVYGAVVAFNLFIMFMNVITGMSIGSESDSFINTIFSLVLILGGAMAASGGADLFSSLLGGQPQQGGNLGQMIYSGMQGMALGGALARGGRSLLLGGRGRGATSGGSGGKGGLGGILGLAGKGADAAGRILGGNKYTAAKTHAGNAYQNLKNVLSGKGPNAGSSRFMKVGGIGGLATKGAANLAGAASRVPQAIGEAAKGKFDGI